MALRSQQFVVDRELQLKDQRDKIKPDIIWNTELGLKQTTSQLAWAERERAALFRRMVEFFQKYDLLVTPSAPTAAFDVNLRAVHEAGLVINTDALEQANAVHARASRVRWP